MGRPEHPGIGCVLPSSCIRALRERQESYDRDPEDYEKYKKEWSLDACIARGYLPTGEPIEAKFGSGW